MVFDKHGNVVAVGDRVCVDDPGLAELRRIMRDATGVEPAPNHCGVITEIRGDVAAITFDDGGAAPYALDECEIA